MPGQQQHHQGQLLLARRPAGVHRHLWALLALLAQEPPLGWLRETLRQAATTTDLSAATAPLPPEEEEEENPRGRAHALAPLGEEAGAEHGQRGAAGRGGETPRGAASTGEPLSGSQSLHTFREQLLGPQPLEAVQTEMRVGHPKIWKTCSKSLQLFITFREEAGSPSAWPLPVNQMQQFVASMRLVRFSALAMQMHLAALSYMSHMLGFPDPFQNASIEHMMEDLRQQTRFSTPLTVEKLEGLVDSLEAVCPDYYERLLFRAAFVVAFFLALKPEEIVVEDSVTPNLELLYMSSCEILEDSIGLRMSVSETGLERKMFRFTRSREHRLCPVDVLHNYLAVRPPGEGPLFMCNNEDPLSREHFLAIFHSALRQIDLPPEQYNMHSFWLGSLVTAVTNQCPGTIICHLARWPSRGIRRRRDSQR